MTLDETLNQAVECISVLAIGRMSDTLHLDIARCRQIGNQSRQRSGFDDDILIGLQDQDRGCDVTKIVGGVEILYRRASPFDGFHSDVAGNRDQKVQNVG